MYVTRNILSTVKNFIMQCPFIGESEIDFHVAPSQAPPVHGNIDATLAYEGSYDVEITPEITGEYNVARREVFCIRLALLSSDSADFERLFAFIDNFQQWVDTMTAYGQAPTPDGCEIIKLWADNAVDGNTVATDSISRHTIRLHIVSKRSFQ